MKKLRFHYTFPAFIILLILTWGCTEQQTPAALRTMPNAFGKMNELTIITDDEIWESDLGDTIDFYYTAAFPILPQPEPILDVKHFSAQDLRADRLRKELRTYLIIANLGDPNSGTTRLVQDELSSNVIEQISQSATSGNFVVKDKWAKDQIIIFLLARNAEELEQKIKNSFPSILKKIKEHDRRKMEATVYLEGQEPKLEREVMDKMGVNIRIPGDYFQALSDGKIIWMRRETDVLSSNIIISRRPYTDRSQLSAKNLKAIRDSIGRQYVSSQIPGTYMKINDVDLPMLTSVTTIDGKYALEARGIWEIVNDYMGGSFISYLIHDPRKNELIFVDGFIHAPGEDKRNFMLYLEHIFSTIRIP